jgi:hypothetical protein
LLFLVAFAGCSIAKCGQAFSLFRIPNFIICRIEGLVACIHLAFVSTVYHKRFNMTCIPHSNEDK